MPNRCIHQEESERYCLSILEHKYACVKADFYKQYTRVNLNAKSRF